MSAARFIDASGKKGMDLELSPEIFDVQVNVPVMHEVVRAQLAAARAGTHSTKTRGEVRGGGRKPWRQKGTGRARHGSRRSPIWVGGGIIHGPRVRDHSMRINRKTRALALRSALTDRAREGRIVVVDLKEFEEPETKKARELLAGWNVQGKVLIVVGRGAENELPNAIKSFRNLPEVFMVAYPTTYTVLAAETVIFTKKSLEQLQATVTEKPAESPEGAEAPAESPETTEAPAESPEATEVPAESEGEEGEAR